MSVTNEYERLIFEIPETKAQDQNKQDITLSFVWMISLKTK